MNKTQYDYLKHSAKGQTWRNHKYTRIENGRYIYDKGGDDEPKTKSSILDKLSNYTQKGINNFSNEMSNKIERISNSQEAKAVTALMNLAESYADEGDYQSVANMFMRYYGQLSPDEKKEILKEDPNNKRGSLEIWVGRQISNGKSVSYITAGCLYKYAMAEGINIADNGIQEAKKVVNDKITKAKEYGKNFISNVTPKKEVQSARSKYYNKRR